MKKLSEHNADIQRNEEYFRRARCLAGVACDMCGAEMELEHAGTICLSNPPSQWVICRSCAHRGLMYGSY